MRKYKTDIGLVLFILAAIICFIKLQYFGFHWTAKSMSEFVWDGISLVLMLAGFGLIMNDK